MIILKKIPAKDTLVAINPTRNTPLQDTLIPSFLTVENILSHGYLQLCCCNSLCPESIQNFYYSWSFCLWGRARSYMEVELEHKVIRTRPKVFMTLPFSYIPLSSSIYCFVCFLITPGKNMKEEECFKKWQKQWDMCLK